MPPATLARVLKEHRTLHDLSDAHLSFMAGCARNVRCRADTYVFRENEEAGQIYLLREGRVAIEIGTAARGIVVIEALEKGDVMGWSTLFPPYRWLADARAVEDTLLIAVDGVCIRGKMEQDPQFGYAFVYRMLREVHRRLERARLQQLDVYRAEG
jgi:CRP-like cAMP-binding protein